jgi:hypothetical protein
MSIYPSMFVTPNLLYLSLLLPSCRHSLMLRQTPLLPPRAHRRNIGRKPLLLRPVRLWCQLHQRVQRHLHPRTLALVQVVKVGKDTPHDGLVRHNDHILAALQLHDDRLQPDHDVAVALAAAVAVVVLVVVAGTEVFRVLALDFLVGHAVAETRLELVKRLPLELLPPGLGGEVARGLDRALERRGPDGQGRVFGNTGFADEFGEGTRVQLAALRKAGVAADFAFKVIFGFAMLRS